jgi:hypothetical protein
MSHTATVAYVRGRVSHRGHSFGAGSLGDDALLPPPGPGRWHRWSVDYYVRHRESLTVLARPNLKRLIVKLCEALQLKGPDVAVVRERCEVADAVGLKRIAFGLLDQLQAKGSQ